MSKKIKITEDDKHSLFEEILEAIVKSKVADGKFTFTKDYTKLDRKAQVYITELAWLKMSSLVLGCDKEIAWRGTCERLEDEEDAYIINDIFCYPQIVTGTTVTTDDEEEMNWYANLPDEVIDNLKFQGHSHVNMGVTPSGTDKAFYDDVLQTIPDDGFYIFMIWNKKGDRTVKIYDMAKNIFFDTEDCKVEILDELGILRFQKESLEMVKEKKYTPTTYTGYNYQNNYNKPATTQKSNEVSKPEAKKTENKDAPKKMKRLAVDDWDDDDDYYDNYYRKYNYNDWRYA